LEAVLVVVSLLAVCWMIQPLFGVRRSWAPRETATIERQLLDERAQLLRAMKDLEQEQEAGSISADEFEELRADYMADAAAVYRRLDELGIDIDGSDSQGSDNEGSDR
jgi:hypothetical protein